MTSSVRLYIIASEILEKFNKKEEDIDERSFWIFEKRKSLS